MTTQLSTAVTPVVASTQTPQAAPLPVAQQWNAAAAYPATDMRPSERAHHIVYLGGATSHPSPLFCGMNRSQLKLLSVSSTILALTFWSLSLSGYYWASFPTVIFGFLGVVGCTGVCAAVPVDEHGLPKNSGLCCGCEYVEHQTLATVGSVLALVFLILGMAVPDFSAAGIWCFAFTIIGCVGCIGQCNARPDDELLQLQLASMQHFENRMGRAQSGHPPMAIAEVRPQPPATFPLTTQPTQAAANSPAVENQGVDTSESQR